MTEFRIFTEIAANIDRIIMTRGVLQPLAITALEGKIYGAEKDAQRHYEKIQIS